VVFVGTDDVAGVEVVRTPTLPLNSQKSPAANPAVARNSAVLRLPALRGIIVDAETGATVTGGTVFVVGETWSKFDLGPDGKFEFQNLLPGRYELEVQGLGYPTFRRSFEMIEVDLNLAFRTN
jgi:hypothetical protein